MKITLLVLSILLSVPAFADGGTNGGGGNGRHQLPEIIKILKKANNPAQQSDRELARICTNDEKALRGFDIKEETVSDEYRDAIIRLQVAK